MAYIVQANDKMSQSRAFYVLYIGPNNGGTGHSVFKSSTKQMIITPRCKTVPIPDNVIEVVKMMGEDEGMPDRIYSSNIHKESTLDALYGDIDSQNDSSCVSDKSWDMSKDGSQIDQKTIVYNDVVDDDKINDQNKKDVIHLQNVLANNNNVEHGGVINQQNKQENHFGVANNNL